MRDKRGRIIEHFSTVLINRSAIEKDVKIACLTDEVKGLRESCAKLFSKLEQQHAKDKELICERLHFYKRRYRIV